MQCQILFTRKNKKNIICLSEVTESTIASVKASSNLCSRRQSSFVLQRKLVLTFHVNRLQSRFSFVK